jgi:hypothetical protein
VNREAKKATATTTTSSLEYQRVGYRSSEKIAMQLGRGEGLLHTGGHFRALPKRMLAQGTREETSGEAGCVLAANGLPFAGFQGYYTRAEACNFWSFGAG